MTIEILDPITNKIIGYNKSLNGIAEISNVRKQFSSYCQKRSDILEQESILITPTSNIDDNILRLSQACTGILSESYRVIDSSYLLKPFIFTYKKKDKIDPIGTYHISRLLNSICKNIMIDESIEIFTRAKRSAYILYDYWFHKKDNIKEISFCVRTDLKNLISLIISRSCSDTYRNLNTMEMVNALRLKLDAEELLGSTYVY